MIKFRKGMDAHSLTIERDHGNIGMLQWHADRPPRLLLMPNESISIDDLRLVIEKFDEIKAIKS